MKGEKALRSRRLTRLRTTLLPIFLLTEKPTRRSPVLFFLYTTTRHLHDTDLPVRYTYLNSLFRFKEYRRFISEKKTFCAYLMHKASFCPLNVCVQERFCRSLYSYACGNREPFFFAFSWAGKYEAYITPLSVIVIYFAHTRRHMHSVNNYIVKTRTLSSDFLEKITF